MSENCASCSNHEFRPEYLKKVKRIIKQKKIKIGTVAQLRKRYES